MDQIINHKFEVMSVKTAKKDGQKYLGKDGSQAWLVSVLIGEVWHNNMIYAEEFLPKKDQNYDIKIEKNGQWDNWDYKILTKKEQMKVQTQGSQPSDMAGEVLGYDTPPTPTSQHETAQPEKEEVDWDHINRGKTRCQVVCAMMKEGNFELDVARKEYVNQIVEFIFTGK